MLVPSKLENLAKQLNNNLYIVGGYVRNYLIDKSQSRDVDLCGDVDVQTLLPILEKENFTVTAVNPESFSVHFTDLEFNYEFTSFKQEFYDKGGRHKPKYSTRISNVLLDAKRRDFKCNAIYYDVKNKKIIDLLGGIDDVKNKRLNTVISPNKVFCCDGLRLLRLCRFYGELDFKPSFRVIKSAKAHVENLLDLSKPQVFLEIEKMLVADEKYDFSSKIGHYNAFLLLNEIGGTEILFKNLIKTSQKKFNKSKLFKSLLYADKSVRLACFIIELVKSCHQDSQEIANKILTNFNVKKSQKEQVLFLVSNFSFSINGIKNQEDARWFIVKNYKYIDDFLKVKNAFYKAKNGKLDLSPQVKKWQNLIQKLKTDGTPFSVKDLKVSGLDLINAGETRPKAFLHELFRACVINPKLNEKSSLLRLIDKKFIESE